MASNNNNPEYESIWASDELTGKETHFRKVIENEGGYFLKPVPPFQIEEYRNLIEKMFKISDIDYIGRGSFGFVFKGIDIKSWTKYSIKVMNASDTDLLNLLKFGKDCKNEIHIMQRLKHDHIVKYFDCLKIYDETCSVLPVRCAIKMEYLHKSLKSELITRTFNDDQCMRLAMQIGSALSYMHEIRIAHHDIKPNNIMIELMDNSNNPINYTFKLIDFGLAKMYQGPMRNARETSTIGCPIFMSPEKNGNKEYNPFLSDSYSFGILLVSSLSGLERYHRMWTRYDKVIPTSSLTMLTKSKPLTVMLSRLLVCNPSKRSFINQVLQNNGNQNCVVT